MAPCPPLLTAAADARSSPSRRLGCWPPSSFWQWRWWPVAKSESKEAITSARDKTTILANAVVAPGMPRGLVTGDPAAIAAMQKLANDQLLGPDVARVKIWAEDGTIVFSMTPD